MLERVKVKLNTLGLQYRYSQESLNHELRIFDACVAGEKSIQALRARRVRDGNYVVTYSSEGKKSYKVYDRGFRVFLCGDVFDVSKELKDRFVLQGYVFRIC